MATGRILCIGPGWRSSSLVSDKEPLALQFAAGTLAPNDDTGSRSVYVQVFRVPAWFCILIACHHAAPGASSDNCLDRVRSVSVIVDVFAPITDIPAGLLERIEGHNSPSAVGITYLFVPTADGDAATSPGNSGLIDRNFATPIARATFAIISTLVIAIIAASAGRGLTCSPEM